MRANFKLKIKQHIFLSVPDFYSTFSLTLDTLGFSSRKQVKQLLQKAVAELKDYCKQKSSKNDRNREEASEDEDNNSSKSSSENADSDRFENLLLLLGPLRSLQPDVLEELFFAGLIGNVQIDSVVPYILKMEASEYKGQFGGR